jgi:hypothetical protein
MNSDSRLRSSQMSAGWHLRARWHRGRPDDFVINEFAHDRCGAPVAAIVETLLSNGDRE